MSQDFSRSPGDARLQKEYSVLYQGSNETVAHEMIVDCREFKAFGVEVTDIAKRLIDYGFHAPTVSFPVAGTLMIEPTESESLDELNRFVEAMLSIREEIRAIEKGEVDAEDNVLKMAPHTAKEATATIKPSGIFCKPIPKARGREWLLSRPPRPIPTTIPSGKL